MRLFVYGTLMKGGPNAHLLVGCRLLAKARTKSSYYMVSNEAREGIHSSYRYPYVTKVQLHDDQGGGAAVKGEVYEFDEVENADLLSILDALEGHPEHYRRQSLHVATDCSDEELYCDAYILENAATLQTIASHLKAGASPPSFRTVPSGDWRAFTGDFAS